MNYEKDKEVLELKNEYNNKHKENKASLFEFITANNKKEE